MLRVFSCVLLVFEHQTLLSAAWEILLENFFLWYWKVWCPTLQKIVMRSANLDETTHTRWIVPPCFLYTIKTPSCEFFVLPWGLLSGLTHSTNSTETKAVFDEVKSLWYFFSLWVKEEWGRPRETGFRERKMKEKVCVHLVSTCEVRVKWGERQEELRWPLWHLQSNVTVGLLIWLLHRELRPCEWWVSPEKGHHSRAGGRKRMDPEIGNQPWKVALLRQKRDGRWSGWICEDPWR